MKSIYKFLPAALFAIVLSTPTASLAHCDSVAGPVAKDVKSALASGQLSPVLKWIRAADEAELRAAFNRALLVRKNGADAASLADQFFLETAIRLHRASEGEPYTGIKSASAADEPAPAMVDAALRSNSFDAVKASVASEIKAELQQRIEALKRAQVHAEESPDAGREYVRSYVGLVHYIERVQSVSGSHASGEDPIQDHR